MTLPLRFTVAALLGGLFAGCFGLGRAAAQPTGFLGFPESSSVFTLMDEEGLHMELTVAGWGPGWSWMGFGGETTTDGQRTRTVNRSKVSNTGAAVETVTTVEPTDERSLRFEVTLTSDRDTELTYIILGLKAGDAFADGKVEATLADGTQTTVDLPLGRAGVGEGVEEMVWIDGQGRPTTITFAEPTDVASDGDARIVLARELSKDEPVTTTMMVELPDELTWFAGEEQIPQEAGFERWYTFEPTEDYDKASMLGMSDWLERPAGKHGRILRDGQKLMYNGKPIKLWGLNVCYSSCAPEKELAEKRAAFYAKHGVNAVRLHKYADGTGWAGIQSEDSFVEFDAEALDRMDYFVAKLKEHGIYVKLSSTFGVKLGPADMERVPYADEFGQMQGKRLHTGHGSVYLSRELQDLQIEQIVKILNHRNPYTGLTYAEDPAIAIVEMFNEDSALFYGTMGKLQNVPTLRQRAAENFFDWLKERYGTKEKLIEAWGEQAINSFRNEGVTNESWEDGYIVPMGNPWFYDPAELAGSQAPKRARLLDTMLFYYEVQNDFYDRYLEAIREAGYAGEVLSSNWQAGRAFSHYYNLHSDARIGMIDRHNYFGGGNGSKINDESMMRVPGSGMLSAGMQQVSDLPFSLSEWIHVLPNEWGAEGPALIGAYGMGLNGWDVSFIFQNRDDGGYLDRIAGRWEVSAPQVFGMFPAVSRQVHRGDVHESDVVAKRYVHVPSLHEGKLGFNDQVTQQHDVKTFDSDKVPAESLAVARCVVEFTDRYRDTPAFDLSEYRQGGVYRSATGQLAWSAGEAKHDGHVTIDSPGTKAVVGFAAGETARLGSVTITPDSRFAAIYVSARRPDATVESADDLLITAMARARNTGMKVFDGNRIITQGKAPVVLEPVVAQIRIDRPGAATVHVLDHDGAKTGRTIPIRDGVIQLDTARDKTPFYAVSYE
jgi:hypothetical protein